MPQIRHYTESEIEFIKENYDKMSVKEIAEHLGRTQKAIRNRMEILHISLSTLERNAPHKWTDYEISFIRDNFETLSDAKIGKALGLTTDMIFRKRWEMGIRINKRDPYISNEYVYQYINGVRTPLHRYTMEQHIGRKLSKEERVHHINGDKQDYRIENLYLCENRSEHMLVHASLEKVAYELIKSGVIKFNKETGQYYT